MAIKKFNSVAGFSVGEEDFIIDVVDLHGNVTANDLVVTSNANLNNLSNITITGGTSGYTITTDGNGNLTWTDPGAAAGISGQNNYVQFNTDGSFDSSANFTFNPATSTLTVTGNTNVGNITVTGSVTVSNISSTSGNITITASGPNGHVFLSPTGSGTVDAGGKKITNLAEPSATTDAVTKFYVDNAVAGLDWKQSVEVLADTNIPLTGSTPLLIDSHSVIDGYRILLTNQTSASQNGIYDVSISSGTYTLTRSSDADTYSELIGTSVFVVEGSTYGSTGWLQTNHYITSFTGQQWVQFSGSGTYVAGNGLALNGTVFDVQVDDSTIEIVDNQLKLKSGGALSNPVLGNVDSITITGGTANQYLRTDGSGNLSFATVNAFVSSNITSIVAGSDIIVDTDYTDPSYPAGKFSIWAAGPVSFTATDVWSSGSTSKNQYANYIASSINTRDVNITLSLSNASFSVQSSDTITIGSSTITGANLTNLGISGTGGTYTIPNTYFSTSVQTASSSAVSLSLTTNRGVKTTTGSTLTTVAPVAYNVTAINASFPAATVPYFSLNQTFSWSATVTGTTASGNVSYSGASSGTLTTSGAISGTSSSLDSSLNYTVSSSDYTGEGLYGAGTRTIPSTVSKNITPATKYYPLFHKVTGNSSNPNFTTSDTYNANNYVTGQGATTTANTSDYTWIAIPGSSSHTFAFVFLGSEVMTTPATTYTGQTISGYTYNVYGFTNYNAATFIYTKT